MAIGSGVGGFVGFAPESTPGTYVAPTRFLEVETAGLKKTPKFYQGGGIANGNLVERGQRRVQTTYDVAGAIKAEVVSKGFGILLNQIFGGTVTPVVQGATAAYLQTHPLSVIEGKALTAQLGVPNVLGTLYPYSYSGLKIAKATFDCAVDQPLMLTMDLDGTTYSEAQTLATPAYVLGNPLHFAGLTVKAGTFGSEAAVAGVRGFSVTIDRPMKADRFYANGGGTKSEQITNNKVKVTGTLNYDFLTKADFADKFNTGTPFSLVISVVGPLIASTFYEALTLTLPACYLDAETPSLDGGYDIATPNLAFTALWDGANPAITCTYMSTDTAL
jgi:hypothetical protein